MWNKGPVVSIWNDREAQKLLVHEADKYFPNFHTVYDNSNWTE